MYRVTFKCGICNEEFDIEIEHMLDAVKVGSEIGCKKCEENGVPDEKKKLFLLKHVIIDEEGNEVKPTIDIPEYTWSCVKRDSEIDFDIFGGA